MPSKYKFRLQKLLDIRLDNEEKSKVEFKNAVREKNSTEEKLKILEDNYDKYNRFNSEESIVEKKIKLNYLKALNIDIENTNNELEEKTQIVEQKRNELKQRQIERKTVEILKEKQEEAFIKEQKLIEQNNNDEFALYGHIRRKNN